MCSDPDIDWHPHSSACWPTATIEWANRRLRELHKDDKKTPMEMSETDGVALYPSLIEPAPEYDPFA